jgi:hypothetical protein
MKNPIRIAGAAVMVLLAVATAASANWPEGGLPVFEGASSHWLMGTLAMPPAGHGASPLFPSAVAFAYGGTQSPAWSLVDDIGVVSTGGVGDPYTGFLPAGAVTGYRFAGFSQTTAAGAVVVWQVTRPNSTYQLRLARPLPGTWTTPWPDSGIAVNAQAADWGARAVVGTVDGGAVVGWTDVRAGVRQLHAQRFGENGSPQWAADGVTVGDTIPAWLGGVTFEMVPDAGHSNDPQGTGAWLIWKQPGTYLGPALLHAQRVTGSGAIAATRASLGPVDWYGAIYATADGAGGFYLLSGNGGQLLGWRVLANGSLAPGWPDAGVAVNVPASGAVNPTIASPASELDVAWSDSSDAATRYDVRVQRILPDGTRPAGWGPNGVAVTSGTGNELASSLTANLRVGWQDIAAPAGGVTRGKPTVGALRADGTPEPAWPAGGTKLGDLLGAPSLVDNGAGGLITLWQVQDFAAGTTVYAQVVSASGVASAPQPQLPARLRLGAPTPNPASGSVSLVLSLPRASHVEAEVFDLAGRREAVLLSGELPAGRRTLAWDGRDARGALAPSGVHFVRVRVDGVVLTRPVVRLR